MRGGSQIILHAVTLLVGRQEGHQYEVGCWFVGGDDLTGALHVFYVQLLPQPPSLLPGSSNKIQNRDILVLANPGPHGK